MSETRLDPEITRILRRRAEALAKPVVEAGPPTDVLELLVFSLAGERYGIETIHVLEAIPLRELTPVPCAPPFVLGVVSHRGRVLPLLDLRRLLDLPSPATTDGRCVVVIDVGAIAFALVADAVAGIARAGAHEVAPPPATLAGEHRAFVRGVLKDLVAVLDLPALARDPRLVVNEGAER